MEKIIVPHGPRHWSKKPDPVAAKHANRAENTERWWIEGGTWQHQHVANKKAKMELADQRAAQDDPKWEPLIAAAGDRKSSQRRDIEWAYQNIAAKIEDVDHKTIPSASAVMMLRHAKENRVEFLNSVINRFMPTKSELEKTEVKADDNQHIFDAIARVEEMARQSTKPKPDQTTEGAG